MIKAWIAFWDEKESPTTLVAIRVLLALVMLYELTQVGIHGIPAWLWGPVADGGVAQLYDPPLVYRLFPMTATTAIGLCAVLMISIVSFGVGFFTRTSAFLFV